MARASNSSVTMMNRLLALGWLVALGLLPSPATASPCVKTVRSAIAPPYFYPDESGGARGLHADLIREALRRMQCEARFVDMPWARALRELQAGQLDMLPAAADTPERKAFAWFSRPTNSARTVVFVRSDLGKKFRFTKLAELIGTDFRLAVRRDASYGVEYDALIGKPQFLRQLTFVSSPKTGMQMMAAGRVDGMVADELTGLLTIEQLGLHKVVGRSGLVTSEEADLVAFSKATTDRAFVQGFNHAIGLMMADGSYKKLLEMYLPCPVSVEKLGCR